MISAVYQGAGNVDVIIYSDEQEEINSWSQCLSEDGIDGETFHYLVIPENANNGSVRRLENKAYTVRTDCINRLLWLFYNR